MKGMCTAHKAAWVLVIVGGVNWGLIGFLDWNLVNALFGGIPFVESLVYMLVGLSALLLIGSCKCKACKM